MQRHSRYLEAADRIEALTQDELLDEVNRAFHDYDNRRKLAVEILQCPGMEEVIIDELESMGFLVTEAS
jgi:uncharacterized protein YjgD (DUF1641 family)